VAARAPPVPPRAIPPRHNNRPGVLFIDGHVESVGYTQVMGNDKDMWGHSGL